MALGVVLVRWFGLRPWQAVAIGAPAAGLAFALPGHPELAFTAGVVGLALVTARDQGELGQWFASSWGYAKQILPLLLGGVLVAGLLLGRPGHEGLIPSGWVEGAVGGNGLGATLFASVAGAFMYFATLTEVPILQGLIGAGMGPGPSLALLLAGPASVAAQYDRHRQRYRLEENFGLHHPGGGDGDGHRSDLRNIYCVGGLS